MVELIYLLSEAAAEGHGEVHATPSNFGVVDATVWVSIAMLILIAIVLWKKVPALIGASLDKRIAEIKGELDEAKALRVEAEKLRTEYEGKLASAAAEAEDMKARAEEEAAHIIEDAKTNAAGLVARRKQMAEDKIAAAERSALADIRATAANAATGAAAALIAAKHDAAADKGLVDSTIADLGGKLN
ncbi:MAG: F0F1 ATP synthase subunit B [Blastomonas sp.]